MRTYGHRQAVPDLQAVAACKSRTYSLRPGIGPRPSPWREDMGLLRPRSSLRRELVWRPSWLKVLKPTEAFRNWRSIINTRRHFSRGRATLVMRAPDDLAWPDQHGCTWWPDLLCLLLDTPGLIKWYYVLGGGYCLCLWKTSPSPYLMRQNFSMFHSADTSNFFQNNHFFEKNSKSLGFLMQIKKNL